MPEDEIISSLKQAKIVQNRKIPLLCDKKYLVNDFIVACFVSFNYFVATA
jgi:hypothetical protein